VANGVDTQHVAEMEDSWLQNILNLVPTKLQKRLDSVAQLSSEMREDYHMSVKKAIVDFVLKDPRAKNDLDDEMHDTMEDFLLYKASIPSWQSSYQEAYSNLRNNILVTNASTIELFGVWHKFKSIRLFDSDQIVGKVGPHELKTFRSSFMQKLEKANEKILTSWYPAILNVFYQGSKRKEWISIPNDRLESFFKLVSLLLADQIRELVLETAKDYISLFEVCDKTKKHKISFQMKLVLEDTKIRLEPSVSEMKSTLENILDTLFSCADRIPRIETQLFANGQTAAANRSGTQLKPDQCIYVGFEATYPMIVADMRTKLKKDLAKLLESPVAYISTYDTHKALISGALDSDVTEFLSTKKTHEMMMEEIKKYRFMASNQVLAAFPFSVSFPLIDLNCGELITNLADRAVALAGRLVERMGLEYQETCQMIIDQFQSISNTVTTMPNDVEEMCALQKFIDEARSTKMKKLDENVEEAKKKLNFMVTFSDLKKEDYDMNTVLFSWPQKIGPIFAEGENNLIKSRALNGDELLSRKEKLISELEGYCKQIEEYETFSEYADIHRYLKSAQRLQSKLESIAERIGIFNHEEEIFGWDTTKLVSLQPAFDSLSPFLTLYQTSVDFQKSYQSWMSGSFLKLDPEFVENEVSTMWRNIYKLCMSFQDKPVPLELAHITKEQIEKFKVHLPLITTLCNPGFRDRHWRDISQLVGFRFQPDETTSLSAVLERNFSAFMADLEQISGVATKEFSFEKALKKMYGEWEGIKLVTLDYRDTGTQILGGIDEIQTLLDDHIVKTQTMKGSPFIKAFEEEARVWDSKLLLIQEILDEWLKVQATWLYLEPIFSSEDIMRQMPSEGKRFVSVNKTWKDIMAYTVKDPQVLNVCEMPNLLTLLKDSNVELELIQKGLNQYLEVKRLFFPRFFFLSNDEMLEILSETRDPTRVQPHLKKCFEGIDTLQFNSSLDILGMYSSAKEFIAFQTPISTVETQGAVEKWLYDVEKSMLVSMKNVCRDGYEAYKNTNRDKWVLSWPGQVVLGVSQIFWTAEVEQTIMKGDKTGLKSFAEICTSRLNTIVDLVRGSLGKVARSTLEALVVIEVHARDVVEQLNQAKITTINDFAWLSQLRYYNYSHEEGILVKMINSVQKYGYEYLGNSARLVITPLTDRCYRTLFGALQLNLGGAPEGPAGTGKTETVKDLAKALAMFCVVYNCSDGLDFIAMGKFFKGLASAGAWACFDEFNRIDLEVLSVVAQQILTIQRAKAAGLEKFMFEGTELNLNPVANCFITMNPGYAGRSELPDNLKALFRLVVIDQGLLR
jgi:dynein heavy chain